MKNLSTVQTEPVMFRGIIVSLVIAVLTYFGVPEEVSSDAVEAIVYGLLILFTFWRARQKVIPVAVVNEAGFTTGTIKSRAESATYRPVQEDEEF